MPTSTPPADPDSLAVLHALSRPDLSPEDAYNAMEGLRNMAAANLIDRFESKLDARFRALEAEIRSQRAMLWALIGILGAAVASGLVALLVQGLK